MPERPLSELEDLVGRSRTTVEELTIEAGKVAEFAGAIGDERPLYRDERAANEQGFDRIPAPPTFTQIGRFPHYTPDDLDEDTGVKGFELGFDPARTVHGEQTYEFERPAFVGDTLTGTTTLTDVYERESGDRTLTFAVFETEYRTPEGELVLTDRSTVIET